MAPRLCSKIPWARKLMVRNKRERKEVPVKKYKNISPRAKLELIPDSHLSFFPVALFRGEVLKLTKIARNEMGSYLCIASNSVPPSVSKRISLNIHCEFFSSLPIDENFSAQKLKLDSNEGESEMLKTQSTPPEKQ